MVAAGAGDHRLVRRLLTAGAEVDAANRNGGTALMFAAKAGSLPTVEALLERGADVTAEAVTGWTALTLAAAKGHSEVAARLAEAGGRVNHLDAYGWTPLMRAIGNGYGAAALRLLELPGVAVETADLQGRTALHHAARTGLTRVAAELVRRGADPRRRDRRGRTPVEIARAAGHSDLVRVLQRGAPAETR